jgi:hypothetical protein
MHFKMLSLFVFLISVAVGNAFALSPSGIESSSQEKIVWLPANYDFLKPNFGGKRVQDGVSIIWADTLQLLNKSIWNADVDEPVPVSIDKALNQAIEVLGKSGVHLGKTHFKSISLQSLFFDAAENVWYYEIIFDAGAKTPPVDGKRNAELHRVIVLMDGTAIAEIIRPFPQIKGNFDQVCEYKKSLGVWEQIHCVSRASSANPAIKLDTQNRAQ